MSAWGWAWLTVRHGRLGPTERLYVLHLGYHGGRLAEPGATTADALSVSAAQVYRVRQQLVELGVTVETRARTGRNPQRTTCLTCPPDELGQSTDSQLVAWAWSCVREHWLSPAQSVALLWVAHCGGTVTHTWRGLGRACGACHSTTRPAVEALARRGLLEVELGVSNRPHTLRLLGGPS